jgi:hypothetical protein
MMSPELVFKKHDILKMLTGIKKLSPEFRGISLRNLER